MKTIKTFKGFDGDLKCRGLQYKIGKTFKLPKGEEPELCEKGFHAISDDVSPLEVFSYYAPGGNGGKPSRYCEVELSGTVRKGMSITGLKTIGIPKTISSFMLKIIGKAEV